MNENFSFEYVHQPHLKKKKGYEILRIFWNAGLSKALFQRFVYWQFQFIASQYLPNVYILSCDNR